MGFDLDKDLIEEHERYEAREKNAEAVSSVWR